jgi:hypothetical protein
MTQPSHLELIAAFAQLTQLNPEHLLRGDSFAVDDIECALLLARGDAADALVCQIDFGEPPSERRAESFQALLELNYLQAAQGASFTIAPGSGRVVYVARLDAGSINAESLADLFDTCATRAREWRKHYFLDQEAGNAAPAISPASAAQLA